MWKLQYSNHWEENYRDSLSNSEKKLDLGYTTRIAEASSRVEFEIIADPTCILEDWSIFFDEHRETASTLGNNCAVAVQWFLTNYAGIPEPDSSNTSWNYVGLGLIWPSFIPFPVLLPGRVMSNAKYHLAENTNAGFYANDMFPDEHEN